jgi:glycosyltransferase involved in cell wall biosynthesis
MPDVHSSLDGVRLLVVGEFYEGEEAHRATVRELDLADRTTIVADYVPDEEVATYFAAADVVVLPYLRATQSGITQVALGLGVPMIASRVGGLPEAVREGENGLLVPPGDPAALAAAIVRFYRDDLGAALRPRIQAASTGGLPAEDEIASHVEDFARRSGAVGERPASEREESRP